VSGETDQTSDPLVLSRSFTCAIGHPLFFEI
jgi:hypothetical protein